MSRAPVAGSTLVASQRCVRANTASRAGPTCNVLVEPAELGPRRHPVDVEVGAKAQRIDRPALHALELAHARQVDDVHALGRHVGEAVSGRVHDLRRPAQLGLHVAGDELLDELAADPAGQLPARHLLAVAEDGQRLGGIVELRAQRRQPLVAHQHQEIDLGQVPRRVRVEAARPVLDGIGAVERQRLAGRQRDLLQRARASGP